jgi:hypothetical protein
LEVQLKDYPKAQIKSAISDTKALMQSFARGISDDAIEKDRILRGDGINFPPLDTGQAANISVLHEIELRANALSQVYDSPEDSSRIKMVEQFLREYKQVVALLLIIGGILATAIIQIGKYFWPIFF